MTSRFSDNHRRLLTKPDDPSGREFESMCLLIYGHEFKSRNATFFGRRGQKQHGIDIRISTDEEMITIQCKDTKQLTLEDLKNDLNASISRWTSADATGKPHNFIIATTLESDALLIKAVDGYVETMRQERTRQGLQGKFSVTIHSWDKIENIVKHHPILSHYFLAPALDNDYELYRHETNRLCNDVERYLKEVQLKTAKHEWDKLKRKRDYRSYADVPSDLRQQLLALFTLTGDFEEMLELLNVEIGFKRYWAAGLLLNLRAARVIGANPEHDSLPIEEEVERTARDLLDAIGSLDEQLTLAYWVVLYAKQKETADLGLRKALGLLQQYWPEDHHFPSPEDTYEVAKGQLIRSQWPQRRLADKPTEAQELATALALAYAFIRQVHWLRYGYQATLETEKEQGGWGKVILTYNDAPLFAFYDTINRSPGMHSCKHLLSRHLPLFYQEATRGSMRLERPLERGHDVNPGIAARLMVCSADLLLADVVEGTGKQRREKVAMQTSHLSLERILSAHRMIQIQNDYFPRHVLDEMAALQQDRIVSTPAYFNFPDHIRVDETSAGLMLARELGVPFLLTAAKEIHCAMKFPDKSLLQICVWWPPDAKG